MSEQSKNEGCLTWILKNVAVAVISAVVIGLFTTWGIINSNLQSQLVSTQTPVSTTVPATLAPVSTWTPFVPELPTSTPFQQVQQPLKLCPDISQGSDYEVFWNLSLGEKYEDNDLDTDGSIVYHYFSYAGPGTVEIGAEAAYHGSSYSYLTSQPEAVWVNVHPYASYEGGIALCWDSVNGYRINGAFVGYYDFRY